MPLRNIVLTCRNDSGEPVNAAIEFQFDSGREVSCQTDQFGVVRLPVEWGNDRLSAAVVRPDDRHWTRYIPLDNALTKLGSKGEIRCELVELEPSVADWWRRPFDDVVREDCNGVRIGIIDAGFRWRRGFDHFCFVDTDGAPLERDSFPSISHGGLVSQIFINWPSADALTKATIFFVDVSDPYGANNELDPTAVVAAIELLSEELKVDIINISGGFDPTSFVGTAFSAAAADYVENLTAAIDSFSGLVVASVGNDRTRPVCMPACLPQVVGVSGVAKGGVAPAGSRLANIERFAGRLEGAVGSRVGDQSYYHVWPLTAGKEVDVTAPGSAIWLYMPDGALKEFEGTSFSAPIVSVTLACALARRRDHSPAFVLTKDILSDLCVDLGLSPERQGMGMPMRP